uniref:Uncharacterized protein n=2 Tax=Pan TaxID=9596 RepID=A0A2I3T977_PANTR
PRVSYLPQPCTEHSKVILNGNLHCHFKRISQIFAGHFMEGDTEVKMLSCILPVR